MKKIVLALVVLLFTSPAWADVIITVTQGSEPNEVIISYDASGEAPALPRAFGLDIQLDNDANIVEVIPIMVGVCTELQKGYGIFPGTIQIDAEGNVTDDGTPVAPSDDPGALPGPPDGNGVTIELASLYSPVGVGSPNAPAASGDLVSVKVDKSCTLCVTANVPRAGAKGVVMEDPDQVVTVDYTGACISVEITHGPLCWTYPNQALGDANNDCLVNIADLGALKVSWFKSTGQPGYNPCADFDRSGMVNIADLGVLKVHWFQNVCP